MTCPNLMPPIIALIGFMIAIACILMLIFGILRNSPSVLGIIFAGIAVLGIIFGGSVSVVWLIFWFFPPQHCYAHNCESNYKIVDITFSEHVSAAL